MGLVGKSTAVQLLGYILQNYLDVPQHFDHGFYRILYSIDPNEIVQEQTISKLQLPWQILLRPQNHGHESGDTIA